MDDELKRKIAASLDIKSDAAADPEITRVLDRDPKAREFARGLYALEKAMTSWPTRARSESDWEKLAGAIDKRIAAAAKEAAKVRKGGGVSKQEPDPAAFPEFDEPTPMMESKQVMSDPNENDADLEGLAALTRTSLGPGAINAAPRSLAPSITDEIDDTSSGIVDIKKLAEVARSAASMPPPATVSTPPVAAAAPAAEALKTPAAKTETPKTDVMVSPPTRVQPVTPAPEPKKSYGAVWGLLGGLAVGAAAFAFYTNQGSNSIQRGAEEVADQPAAAPAPPAVVAPVTPPMPESANNAPTPTPEAAPVAAEQPPAATGSTTFAAQRVGPQAPPGDEAEIGVARERGRAETQRAVAVNTPVVEHHAAPRAHTATVADGTHADTPAHQGNAAPPPPAAPAPTPAAPTPAARPTATATATPTTPPPRAAGAQDIGSLLEQVAPGPSRPAAAAQTEAAPSADLPQTPVRSNVSSVMNGLTPGVRACMQGATGTVPVMVTIGNDGAVRSARVAGEHGSDDVGSCITTVVQRAHFAPFQRPTASVTWPFVILPPH